MSALQIFLLGMMVAWTPSLLFLAVLIFADARGGVRRHRPMPVNGEGRRRRVHPPVGY
jgi:hypothetical protein